MESSDSRRVGLNDNFSIPKLIKLIKHSFNDYEFNEVQSILMEREKNMKFELESLTKDRDLIKEELALLEKNQSLLEQEKLKLTEELQSSEANCQKLSTSISRLTDELKDKGKISLEMFEKVRKENLELRTERNKLVSENKRMKKKNTEHEHEKSKLKEELQSSEANCEKLNTTISRLIEKEKELTEKMEMLEEVCRENLELRSEHSKLLSENERMKLKNSENEQLINNYRQKILLLDTRVVKLEQDVSDLIREKLANVEADRVVEELKGQNLEVKKEPVCANLVVTQTTNESRQKFLECERLISELNQSRMVDMGDTPMTEVKRPKQESQSEALQGVNKESKGLQTSGEIIEIYDSSNDENDIPISGRGNKRGTPCTWQDSPPGPVLKKGRNGYAGSENHLSRIEISSSEKSGDVAESDDDSCTDSYMNNLVASIKNQNCGNK